MKITDVQTAAHVAEHYQKLNAMLEDVGASHITVTVGDRNIYLTSAEARLALAPLIEADRLAMAALGVEL